MERWSDGAMERWSDGASEPIDRTRRRTVQTTSTPCADIRCIQLHDLEVGAVGWGRRGEAS
jgi:hypothetical protein